MSSYTRKAVECFDENIRLFTSAEKTPERFNVNVGLHNMAEAIEQLESKLDFLTSQIQRLLNQR